MVFLMQCTTYSHIASVQYETIVWAKSTWFRWSCEFDSIFLLLLLLFLLFIRFRSICIIVNYYNYEMPLPSSVTCHSVSAHEMRSLAKIFPIQISIETLLDGCILVEAHFIGYTQHIRCSTVRVECRLNRLPLIPSLNPSLSSNYEISIDGIISVEKEKKSLETCFGKTTRTLMKNQ